MSPAIAKPAARADVADALRACIRLLRFPGAVLGVAALAALATVICLGPTATAQGQTLLNGWNGACAGGQAADCGSAQPGVEMKSPARPPLALAQAGVRVPVNQRETFIPDLLLLEWIELRPDATVVQFRFLRAFGGAALAAPNQPDAMRIRNARGNEEFKLIGGDGVLRPGAEDVEGRPGDTFRVIFPALPGTITNINVTEGPGGQVGLWTWYDIKIR